MAFHMGDPTGNGGDSECVLLGNFPSPGSPVTTLPADFTSFLCRYYSFQRKYKCNAFSPEQAPAEGSNKDRITYPQRKTFQRLCSQPRSFREGK